MNGVVAEHRLAQSLCSIHVIKVWRPSCSGSLEGLWATVLPHRMMVSLFLTDSTSWDCSSTQPAEMEGMGGKEGHSALPSQESHQTPGIWVF